MTNFTNPYESPTIKSGYNLINFFKKLIPEFKKTAPEILVDSINFNIKFKNIDGEIVVYGDFGKVNQLDIDGFTYSELDTRFVGNDRIKKIYKLIFNVFNNASNDIKQIIKKLKLFNDNYILNCKYIKTNHGRIIILNDIYKTSIKNKIRLFEKIKTKQSVLDELILDIQPYAQDVNITITTNLKTSKLSENIDTTLYDDLLNTIYTIQIKPTLAISKTLKNWLRGCKNPRNKHIKINDIKINLFDKKLYFKILNNIPISEILENKSVFNSYKKDIINAFILQLTTQSLGQRILECLNLPNKNIQNVYGVAYKNIQIIGDNMIKKYNYYNEDEQVVSYISNPPYMTSDWGKHTVTNESKSFSDLLEAYDLEQEPHSTLYTYFIFRPRLFLKNDFDFFNKYSTSFHNNKAQILIPHSKRIKFDYIKETIKSFGIDENNIIECTNDEINPIDNIYANGNDKVLFIMIPSAAKYFKPDNKTSKKFISVSQMKPYKKCNYYSIQPNEKLDLIDYKIETPKQFFEKYEKADSKQRNELLIAMYGNTNLKTIFDRIY